MKKYIISSFLLLFITFSALSAGNKPYVLLISYDGFRWDYLNRGLTPNLDKIKQNGVSAISFRPAFPSKTFPNHQSIITGMYIENHGIISNYFENPFNGKTYGMKDTSSIRDGRWYLGEAFWETAERNNIISASYFWPGSEMHLPYRHPTYFEYYDHMRPYQTKVDGIMNWLQLPQDKRPHFITLYFHETDTYGHSTGTNSKETNLAIAKLDSVAGYIFNQLNKINMADSVNVIFLSDHGMTDISPDREINIEDIVKEYNCKISDDGPFMQIEPPADKKTEVFNILKKNENHYKVYLKEEMPGYFHYNKHPFISSILLVADMGWSLISNKNSAWYKTGKGNHGYDNNQMDMQGIFLATGPDFKNGYRTGTLWNIDVYPLLCKIFNISPRSNIDGNAERIEFILK
jgi:ectonucleotide pyrophosphatase/phosphodiesterase family member 5